MYGLIYGSLALCIYRHGDSFFGDKFSVHVDGERYFPGIRQLTIQRYRRLLFMVLNLKRFSIKKKSPFGEPARKKWERGGVCFRIVKLP